MVGAFIGALIGGAVGAAIWAVVGFYTGAEIGWIAWGVGVLAGAGAMVGANLVGGGASTGSGIVAAVVAIAAVAAGKLAVIELIYQDDRDLAVASQFSNEILMCYVADQVVEHWEDEGYDIDWPELPEGQYFRWREADYPPDLWAATLEYWDDQTPEHQQAVRKAYREQHETNVAIVEAEYASMSGENFLSGYDAIWILLAVGSAFGLGQGGKDE